jgi:N-methylhydantoinase A
MAWRIGIDSGGHLHGCLPVRRRDGRDGREVWKVPSTPDDPSRGIAQGTSGRRRAGRRQPGDVVYFGHGTTVGTNALIQHRGVKTGLITTEGFRDLMEIGRQKRPDLYDLQADKPPPLVTRDLRFERQRARAP